MGSQVLELRISTLVRLSSKCPIRKNTALIHPLHQMTEGRINKRRRWEPYATLQASDNGQVADLELAPVVKILQQASLHLSVNTILQAGHRCMELCSLEVWVRSDLVAELQATAAEGQQSGRAMAEGK